jgi:predicted lipid-binding transport protein (Tim44 family)
MTGFGVLLIVLGVGSLLLPLFDLQFRLMEFVDPYQPWAGILVGVIGAALVWFGMQRSRAAAPAPAEPATAPAATAAPAATPEPAAAPAPETGAAAPAAPAEPAASEGSSSDPDRA